MANAVQPRRLKHAPRKTLMSILESLPDALFLIDDTETIVYANTSAQTLTGLTHQKLLGSQFWRAGTQLVSLSLYQAVWKTRLTQEWTEVEYRSPVLQTWLRVQLKPVAEGTILQFHNIRELASHQETSTHDDYLCSDILENISDRLVILTPEGMVLDISKRTLEDAHVRREEIIGRFLPEVPWWSSSPTAQKQLRSAIVQASQGKIVRFEARICPQPGKYLDLAIKITPHYDQDTQAHYLICVGWDITARKWDEEFRTLVDTLPQLVWIAGPDGKVIYNNQRLIDYLPMSLEQVAGDGWQECIHPDDKQCVLAAWQTSIQTGTPYEVEHRLQGGTDGMYHWFLVRGVPLRNDQGTILWWVGTCTDIDKQKRAEQQLKDSRESFRVLAEMVPQTVWTMWPDGSLDYTNQRYRDVTQVDFNLEGDDIWRKYIHPDDIERTLALRHKLLRTGKIYDNEYRILDGRTGEYRWYLVRALPIHNENGEIVKWFGTGTDIDDQKRIEEALRQSQARASALMNSNIIGINVVEGEQIIDANDAFLRMTGYTREDLRAGNINWASMTPPEYWDRTQQAHQELAIKHSMTPYEKEYVCKDGSRLPVVVGSVLLQHQPPQGIAFVLDNSARKELERRKDDFISMASHELKTPLTALKLQIQLAQRQLANQPSCEGRPALFKVNGYVKQLERLIGELLDVSKIQAGKLEYQQETIDLDTLIHEVVDTMQQISTTHALVLHGSVPCTLIGDKVRLGQVFINLINNAIKYSPCAKTVEIDLHASSENATIRIRDHGLGIPQEQRDKIFERFYRISDAKQKAIPGLGMGLYIVAEIVKHYEGILTVESEVGKGSTFQVTFPFKRDGGQ
ncbi:PAS domain S-box protein [Ktedonospora formicarum]|uniref:histidine kinase n=1 Tax=Ktedonospora formicarum TaxID=2778364 RepID=A0A8J3I568_9CHLR|nr:PAS domain S-box protein [Ktedonospora formicarum]GHO45574.1 hypothetical protein KSX_37370 [Ktedonospora formicarum]